MVTFDDDFCQFEHDGRVARAKVRAMDGIEWPPPPIIEDDTGSIGGICRWERESFSPISDADRADMTHVVRGALYRPASTEASP